MSAANDMMETMIEWIQNNLQPDDVFDIDVLRNFILEEYSPEELYDEDTLRECVMELDATKELKTEIKNANRI